MIAESVMVDISSKQPLMKRTPVIFGAGLLFVFVVKSSTKSDSCHSENLVRYTLQNLVEIRHKGGA